MDVSWDWKAAFTGGIRLHNKTGRNLAVSVALPFNQAPFLITTLPKDTPIFTFYLPSGSNEGACLTLTTAGVHLCENILVKPRRKYTLEANMIECVGHLIGENEQSPQLRLL